MLDCEADWQHQDEPPVEWDELVRPEACARCVVRTGAHGLAGDLWLCGDCLAELHVWLGS